MPMGTIPVPFVVTGPPESITEPALVMVARVFSADQCAKVKAIVAATTENALSTKTNGISAGKIYYEISKFVWA